LGENEEHYGESKWRTEARQLRTSQILLIFQKFLPGIAYFRQETGDLPSQLQDCRWWPGLHFLTDLTAKLNKLTSKFYLPTDAQKSCFKI